ncbi:hypothetical protein HPP92_015012 [Vanilla planifolia]|uniref:Uncharacterized protein n=1 Tax=Vanilla planifolia TaxID=51239 RepID=A0A835QL31_VANPL|nr:hypothetical protein HPP92_015012 [Vanilla planifolia]
MQTEARVGMMVEGGTQRAFGVVNGGVRSAAAASGGGLAVEGGHARKYSAQCHTKLQKQQQQQPQVGALSHLVAGGNLAISCLKSVGAIRVLDDQVQGMHSNAATLSKASIFQEASRIVREEGFRAFWRGNLVTIVHRLPYSSISFYAYDRYKNLLHLLPGLDGAKQYIGTDVFVRLLGGGLAGMTAASITYPLDLVRTRLAAQTNHVYYQGIWHALNTICREEGVRGLYKGLGATLLGVGPNIAISFSVYETLRSNWQLQRPQDSNVVVSLSCGSVSGIASSTVTFPLDLVRRRMQLEGAAGRARIYRTGVSGTFKHIIYSEGFRGLYRGILPEYYKVVPSIGIAFMTYETLKSCLSELASS